jgi:hypothetical protein
MKKTVKRATPVGGAAAFARALPVALAAVDLATFVPGVLLSLLEASATGEPTLAGAADRHSVNIRKG